MTAYRNLIFLVLVIGFLTTSFGQEVWFKGKVLSSDLTPLNGANILLLAKDQSVPPSFGVTTSDGKFGLKVQPNSEYELTITFIGRESIKEIISFDTSDLEKNYEMQLSPNDLQEVVLNYKPPIQVKKDTTIYSAEAFSDGNERKLKALLKKLPGVEVDRNGDVFVKNKKVTQVLVEDKIFFDGKTRLAVEKIPVDVVDEIQMIEDYQETAFLKDVVESDRLVMNIKLKEGKKNFVFGDIEVGAGIKERYRVHPSIFKYSPKLTLNVIGDINNIATKSFTLGDYLKFEGERNPDEISSLFNSPIVKFLQNDNYFDNKHLFGGFNGQYNPNDKHELRLFTLGLNDDSNSEKRDNFVYQASQAQETRIEKSNKNHQVLLGKVNYRFTPNENTDLKSTTYVESTKLTANSDNNSLVGDTVTAFAKLNDAPNTILGTDLLFNKFFNEKHISSAELSFRFEKGSFDQNWRSDLNLFSPILPIVDDLNYVVSGLENNENLDLSYEFSHYYRLTRTDLLTFELYGNFNRTDLTSNNFQTLSNNTTNNFEEFRNDFSSNLNNLEGSITYRKHFGKILASAGLSFQYIKWNDRDSSLNFVNENNNILPSLKVEWIFSTKKKLTAIYNQSRNNPSPNLRLRNRKILDFNSLFLGNPFLDQNLNDRLLFSYSSFNPYGVSIYANAGYRKLRDQIINANTFSGINGVVQPTQTIGNNEGYDLRFRWIYNRKYWKIALTNNYYQRETISIFNGENIENSTKSLVNAIDFQTRFENSPNAYLEVQNNYNVSKNSLFLNRTTVTKFDLGLEYNYKNWKFQSSYIQTLYRNVSNSNNSNYELITGSIFYYKEDSLWEFGVDFYNLGNNGSKISNSFTIDLFRETNISVFPRTVMFNVYYKL